ncbi:MAG: MinD/ParA family protein [Anaerolineae bacterium]|nr:MinD/ParA family protein [Anaerolineae bacterium]
MSKIISIHSFRGGTGKSNTSANLSTMLAMEGKRVAVVDTDISSPGIHVLLGLHEGNIKNTLNDYLYGKCEISDAAYDVTANVSPDIKGKIFLIPSSMKTGEITRVLKEGYDVGLLNEGFHKLIEDLNLDALVIDTHPGVNEETLLSIALCDVLVIVMRPDTQDFQGTAVTVEVARKLDVPKLVLIVNKTPTAFNFDDVKQRVETTYNCQVAAVLPHSDELMMLASDGVFVAKYPNHQITQKMRQAAQLLMS